MGEDTTRIFLEPRDDPQLEQVAISQAQFKRVFQPLARMAEELFDVKWPGVQRCASYCGTMHGLSDADRDDLAEQVRRLRDHGRAGKYEHPMFGLNCRMDEMQSAIVRVSLRRLEERTERRRQIARRYTQALKGTELLPPAEREAVRHVYHLYVVRSRRRDELAAHLNEAGIATGIHYPIPCHLQEACRTAGYDPVSLPETERAAREILSLPVFPELTDEQVDRIVGSVAAFDAAKPKAREVA